MSCVNGRGFNFDVAPSLVGICCPLISRVGDVGDVGVRSGVQSKSRRFRVRSGVRSKSWKFGVRSGVRNKVTSLGVKIGESE